MMDKRLTVIYADAAEKFVKNVVLYGFCEEDAEYGQLYYDAEHTQLVNAKDLVNLCQKGLIVETNNSANGQPSLVQESAEIWIVESEGVRISTFNNNFFHEFIEEEAEAEEEAE